MRTITAFVRAFRRQWQDEEFRAIAGLAGGLILTGWIVYMLVEHWSPLDSLYFSVVTLATVGYGDLAPTTDIGKGFTIVFIIVGVGILVTFASTIVKGMVKDREEHLRQ